MVFVYTILTLIITALGTISGMGGGVVIKPVMDLIGEYDVATIGIICSVVAFSMAIVSMIRNLIKKTDMHIPHAIIIGLGAIAGGYCGQILLEVVLGIYDNAGVKLMQNIILGSLIIIVLIYTLIKNPPKLKLKNPIFFLLAGVFMGACSSFLGIGGGPINVAIFMLLFSFDIKKAAIYSLVVILFSQISKLVTVAVTTGFGIYDLRILPFMVLAAIFGSLSGIFINKRLKTRAVIIIFNIMQVLVLSIVIANIITVLSS